jgi:hypothetical protein
MKKIIFVVGGIGSARKPILEKLQNTCKLISDDSVTMCMIGNFDFNESLKTVDSKWINFCINQIETHIEMFPEKEYYLFSGSLLCMYIDNISKRFPEAIVYMIKKDDENLFQDIAVMLSKFDVTESEIREFNNIVNGSIDKLVEENGLIWKQVDSPVFTNSLMPNYVGENTESKIKIKIATYNL